jgi:hypothetical protein
MKTLILENLINWLKGSIPNKSKKRKNNLEVLI